MTNSKRPVPVTALVALVAGATSAAIPALRAANESPALRLRERAGTGRLRGAVIVAEVLLAVVLLSAAALLARSFLSLRGVDPGFRAERVLAADISVPGSYDLERRVAFFRELEERVEALPGVEDVSYTTTLPLESGGSAAWLNLLDRPAPDGEPPLVDYRVVGTDFTRALGIELIEGRLPARDVARGGRAEVLVDEVLARRFWPESSAIGREVTLGPDGGWTPPSTVVGVVQAVRSSSLAEDPEGILYVPRHPLRTPRLPRPRPGRGGAVRRALVHRRRPHPGDGHPLGARRCARRGPADGGRPGPPARRARTGRRGARRAGRCTPPPGIPAWSARP